jgi:hypothetical protein
MSNGTPRTTTRRQATRRAADQEVDAPPASVARSEVERRAYERFMQRGGQHGDDVNDWLEAERELLTFPVRR